jgi:hypothetical protein
LEVRDGAPVADVAVRYGTSRQSVYGWKARYEAEGLAGLPERSRRPRTSPVRVPAEVEALVCELDAVIADGTLASPCPHRSPPTSAPPCAAPASHAPHHPPPSGAPISVQRRIPAEGVVMVTRQRLRIGHTHAGKTVTILVEDTHFRVLHNGQQLSLHPRTNNQPVTRFRAYAERDTT